MHEPALVHHIVPGPFKAQMSVRDAELSFVKVFTVQSFSTVYSGSISRSCLLVLFNEIASEYTIHRRISSATGDLRWIAHTRPMPRDLDMPGDARVH